MQRVTAYCQHFLARLKGSQTHSRPSTDEETRFVEVKFSSKIVTRRGVRDLVPLELDFTENC